MMKTSKNRIRLNLRLKTLDDFLDFELLMYYLIKIFSISLISHLEIIIRDFSDKFKNVVKKLKNSKLLMKIITVY